MSVRKKINNNKGVAMIWALVVFLFMTITAVGVMNLFTNNLKQAKHQQFSLEAYYLAYSGTQMAFTALLDDSKELFDQVANSVQEDTAIFQENDIDFANGTIDIRVEKTSEANYPGWIKITSTGTLDSNGYSRTRIMYIDPDNQDNVFWK